MERERMTTVTVVVLPTRARSTTAATLQAILRSRVALVTNGNGPAQRAVIEAVRAIEREVATQAPGETKDKADESLRY